MLFIEIILSIHVVKSYNKTGLTPLKKNPPGKMSYDDFNG